MAFAYVALGALLTLALVIVRQRQASFSAQRPEDYAEGPQFDIRRELNGDLDCEGMIYGPTGRVTSRFTARFNCQWEGNRGVMRETFHYDSGNTQHREWALTLGNDGRILADAVDLVGEGRGRQEGSAVQLNYTIRLPAEAGGHALKVDDWMYLMPNGTIMNRSQFRKFGIQVAELVATMRPATAAIAGE